MNNTSPLGFLFLTMFFALPLAIGGSIISVILFALFRKIFSDKLNTLVLVFLTTFLAFIMVWPLSQAINIVGTIVTEHTNPTAIMHTNNDIKKLPLEVTKDIYEDPSEMPPAVETKHPDF